MTESEIQRQILDYLKAAGILHWRMNLGGVRISGKGAVRNAMKGFPDVAGVMPRTLGRLFAIEVKTKTGKLSPEQEVWRERLTRAGVIHIVARSLDDVLEVIHTPKEQAS